MAVAGENPRKATRNRSLSNALSIGTAKSNGDATQTTALEQAEKERRDSLLRGESKAHPNAAVLELQPQARNLVEEVTLDSLREISPKDSQGNMIAEPDLSNPTRSRWERPLDTIRSFEFAIDKQRVSPTRLSSVSRQSNRYSSAGQYNHNGSHNNGYSYNNPTNYHRPSRDRSRSQFDLYSYDGAAPVAPRRFQRNLSEGGISTRYAPTQYNPQYNPQSNLQSNPQYNPQYNQDYLRPDRQSRSNPESPMNDASSGSDSTAQWVNSTNPSSMNSSYEQLTSLNKVHGRVESSPQRQQNMAGNSRFGGDDDMTLRASPRNAAYSPGPNMSTVQETVPRRIITLGDPTPNQNKSAFNYTNANIPSPNSKTPPPPPEKRKSWLVRRFSKRENVA